MDRYQGRSVTIENKYGMKQADNVRKPRHMERRSMHGSGKEVRPQYLQEHLLVLSTGSALDLMQQKQPEHRRERERD